MRAGIVGPLVEADAGDPAGDIGLELHAEIDRLVVVVETIAGSRRR